MTRPVTDLLTPDSALAACNAAETSMLAAMAKTLAGNKEEKKSALKAFKTAQNNYTMALFNLHRVMRREKSESGS